MSMKSPIVAATMVVVSMLIVSASVVLLGLPGTAAAKLNQGERLWFQCRACHTLKKGDAHKLGPNLYGIMDARAATRKGFRYSKALQSSKLVWNDATMDKWIEKPNSVLTGHRMSYVGIKDAKKRAILVEFLKKETR